MDIETPKLATDAIVRIADASGQRHIIIIERLNPPHGLALPGGFVELGEMLETAVIRETQEELQIDITLVDLLGVYSDPSRDPRGHVASAVFIANTNEMPVAGSDAKAVHVVPESALHNYEFVFDHGRIVHDYLQWTTRST